LKIRCAPAVCAATSVCGLAVPSRRGGVKTTICSTPATRAGMHVMSAVDATFDQQASCSDDFGVLGNQRPLLRRHRSTDRRQQQQTSDDPDAAISGCSRGQHVFQHSVS
jgi:hypothetical protein